MELIVLIILYLYRQDLEDWIVNLVRRARQDNDC